MKKSQIAAQLFTCYNYMQNYKDIELACKELSKIGFSAVQFSGANESLDFKDIKMIFDDYDLVCDSIHADSGEIFNEPEKLIDKLNKFDAKYIVFSCPAPEDMLRTENQAKILANKLEASGKIMPLQVEGIRFQMYILSEDLPLLTGVVKEEADTRARLDFLAPLDPMLWDRKLIEALWDYQYSWEI